MPHFLIDCSENIPMQKPHKEIMQCVYDAAESTNLFANAGVGGIKVRINPFKYFKTGNTEMDFIHVFAHILEGRTPEQKKNLSQQVVARLKALFPEVVYISMTIQDLEKNSFCNQSMV